MINTSSRLVVAADGSGDFLTVQSALDSIPEGNTTPTTILLRNRSSRQLNGFEAKQLRNISCVLKGWQPETLWRPI